MYQMPSIFEDYAPASVFPPVEMAERGAEQARYGKEPFKVTEYSVKVFDMGVTDDRSSYCELMKKLMPMCQNAQCVVVKNDLQVLGGSWKRYVEWFEYKLNDVSLTSSGDRHDMTEKDKEAQE